MFVQEKNLFAFALINDERKMVIIRTDNNRWTVPIGKNGELLHEEFIKNLIKPFFDNVTLRNRSFVCDVIPDFWWKGEQFACHFYAYEFSGELKNENGATFISKNSLEARVFPDDVWNLICCARKGLEGRMS